MDTTDNEIRPDEDLVERYSIALKSLVLPFTIHDGWIHTLKFGLSKHDILSLLAHGWFSLRILVVFFL